MQHSSQHVEFIRKARLSQNESSKVGAPVYVDDIFIRIHNPGDLKNVYFQPAKDADKRAYPEAWARFQNDDDRPPGTPLQTLTILRPDKFGPADIENLKAQKVFTIEQLSALPDSAIKVIGPRSREWAKLAQDHLAKSDTSGLKEENESLRREMDEMKAQMADLMAKRKGGRPPKVKADEPADDRTEHV